MQVHWDVSIASLVTWGVMVGTAIFATGKMTAVLTQLVTAQNELKQQFSKHEEHDDKRFEKISDVLLKLAQEKH